MTEVTVYLAMGSNLGDRAANLRAACDALEARSVAIAARSGLYCTQSVEGGGEGDFLNGAVRARTHLSPVQLLHVTQEVEVLLGRPQPPRRGSRLIDIDILLYGTQTLELPGLQLPHPRMLTRAFVLRPLCDVLEGGWVAAASETW